MSRKNTLVTSPISTNKNGISKKSEEILLRRAIALALYHKLWADDKGKTAKALKVGMPWFSHRQGPDHYLF